MNSEDSENDVEVADFDETDKELVSLMDALQSLPLLAANLYLRMQAFNLDIVDQLLREMEGQMLSEYYKQEGTPVATATVVSALSQLWVFGLYELLRTWRQRAREVIRFGKAVAELPAQDRERRISEQKETVRLASADPDRADPAHSRAFEDAARDKGFRDALQLALDRSELPFRKLESVRVHLAKHEIPNAKGSYGMDPGYSRIDEISQSICWQVPLGNMEVEIISRGSLATACRKLATDEFVPILAEDIQKKLEKVPEQSYGVKRVILVLDDRSEYEAFVAWNKQVLAVPRFGPSPLDPDRVIDVRFEPAGPAA